MPAIKVVEEDASRGVYKIEPLEKTFGVTVGNAMRRTLLSSLPGVAVTSLRVEGATQEFTALETMKEDVLDLVLNVKELKLKKKEDFEGPISLSIDVKGKQEITAADINCPSQIEVVNTDLYLASLVSKKEHFQAELIVEEGRGYSPSSERPKDKKRAIDFIQVDALFAPIKKVNFKVEPTRVEQYTDYDKILFEIETNGTLEPMKCMNLAAAILVEHFSLLVDQKFYQPEVPSLPHTRTTESVTVEPEEKATSDELGQSLEEIGLASRIVNRLQTEGWMTVEDVLAAGKEKVKSLKNFGDKSLKELEEKMEEFGYANFS